MQKRFRSRVQRRHDHPVIFLNIFTVRPDKITFDVHPVQGIIDPSYDIIIFHRHRSIRTGIDWEPFQGGQSLIADQDCRGILLFQIYQVLRICGKLPANLFCFPIGGVFLKIMAQKTLPVGLKRIMNGMPVPVHDTVCTGSQMAVRLQPQLPRIRCPARKSLRFRLQYEIIVLLQGSCHIAAKGNLRPRQRILGRMINIHSGHSQRACRVEMVDAWLNAVRISPPLKIEILGHKLVFSAILPDDPCLPLQEAIHQGSLVFLKLCAQASVDRSPHIRKILPRVDPIAPVVQTKFMVHRIQVILKLLPQILHKALLDIFSCRSIVLCLIVQLKTDHTATVRRVLHQLPDYTFRVKQIDRIGNVHNLTRPIDALSLFRRGKHLGIRLHHPCRHRIGGRSDDHGDPRLLHGVQNPLHMGKIKHPILRLTGAPGGFRDPHNIDPGRLHHLHIFFQTVHRKILLVICRPIK